MHVATGARRRYAQLISAQGIAHPQHHTHEGCMTDLPKGSISLMTSLLSRTRERAGGAVTYADMQRALHIAAANGGEGYVYHSDSEKLGEENAITILAGERVALTIDGLGPSSTSEYLDSISRPRSPELPLLTNGGISSEQIGDLYLLRSRFTAQMLDPAAEETEIENSILVEYDVANIFDVHRERKFFDADPGPMKAEREKCNELALALEVIEGVSLITSSLTGLANPMRVRANNLHAKWQEILSEQSNNPTEMITFGIYFAGGAVMDNPVMIYVTPTIDIKLWSNDALIARLSSPTV